MNLSTIVIYNPKRNPLVASDIAGTPANSKNNYLFFAILAD